MANDAMWSLMAWWSFRSVGNVWQGFPIARAPHQHGAAGRRDAKWSRHRRGEEHRQALRAVRLERPLLVIAHLDRQGGRLGNLDPRARKVAGRFGDDHPIL